MTNRDIGAEILEGLKEIQEYKKGKIKLKTTRLSVPSEPKAIRSKLELSQSAFAGMLGVSLRTLQDWGTREAAAARPGYCPSANCRTTSECICGFKMIDLRILIFFNKLIPPWLQTQQ